LITESHFSQFSCEFRIKILQFSFESESIFTFRHTDGRQWSGPYPFFGHVRCRRRQFRRTPTFATPPSKLLSCFSISPKIFPPMPYSLKITPTIYYINQKHSYVSLQNSHHGGIRTRIFGFSGGWDDHVVKTFYIFLLLLCFFLCSLYRTYICAYFRHEKHSFFFPFFLCFRFCCCLLLFNCSCFSHPPTSRFSSRFVEWNSSLPEKSKSYVCTYVWLNSRLALIDRSDVENKTPQNTQKLESMLWSLFSANI
jgi:hypothetical protein